ARPMSTGSMRDTGHLSGARRIGSLPAGSFSCSKRLNLLENALGQPGEAVKLLDLAAQVSADLRPLGGALLQHGRELCCKAGGIIHAEEQIIGVAAESLAKVLVRCQAWPPAAHRFPRDFITKPGGREIHMHRATAIMLGQLAAGHRTRENNGVFKAKLRHELLQFARIDFVVRAGGRAENDETKRNSQKCSGAQERGMI